MERQLDPLTDERARYDVLVDELLPSLRSAHPEFSVELLLESAIRIAAFRLAGENFVWIER
jgi:hypothetical protein